FRGKTDWIAVWLLCDRGNACLTRVQHGVLDLTSHTSAIENLGWALGVPSVCAYLAQGTFEVPVSSWLSANRIRMVCIDWRSGDLRLHRPNRVGPKEQEH